MDGQPSTCQTLERAYIWSAVGHGEQTRSIVLQLKVLISKFFGAVDGSGSSAVAVDKVTSLNHKVPNLHTR